MLSLHPDLFWISGWVNKYPNCPELGWFNRMQYLSAVEKISRGRRFFPRPSEAYGFWNHFFPGFGNGHVKALSTDKVKNCIKTLNRLQKSTGHKRFVTKITGFPRSNVLEALFDDPVIVWIDRNPEAIIMSFYRQRWRYKSQPEEFMSRGFEALMDEYSELYTSFLQGKHELAAKFRLIEVQYEDLVFDKEIFFRDLLQELGLKNNGKYMRLISSWHVRSEANIKYPQGISDAQYRYLIDKTKSFAQ